MADENTARPETIGSDPSTSASYQDTCDLEMRSTLTCEPQVCEVSTSRLLKNYFRFPSSVAEQAAKTPAQKTTHTVRICIGPPPRNYYTPCSKRIMRIRWNRSIAANGHYARFSSLQPDRVNELDLFRKECQLFGLEIVFHMLFAGRSGQRKHPHLDGKPKDDLCGTRP